MIRFATLVVGGTIIFIFFFVRVVSAQQQEYACECREHKAGARGPTPCSIAETKNYCEITYGVPPIVVPKDKENVAIKLSSLTKQLGLKQPLRLSYDDERIVREIPPFMWESLPEMERENVIIYIISISIFPLIYQNEPDSLLADISKRGEDR